MVIVAGIDGSEQSREVVRRGIKEASAFGVELHLVHVFHLAPMMLSAPIDVHQLELMERKAVWARVEDLLDHPDLVIERVDLEGYPAETLVEYAHEVGADTLVVGSRGRGEFASFMLGSTSHRTIHLARCDVLVVKSPSE